MSEWRPDVLGPGFECLDLDLGEAADGPLVATLVRALPDPLGFWRRVVGKRRELEDVDVLYVHGWSDYFFQHRLAEFWRAKGARFYALDLRRYGRSLREGQSHGYIEDLADYDQEIALALAEMGHPLSAGDGQASGPGERAALETEGAQAGEAVHSQPVDPLPTASEPALAEPIPALPFSLLPAAASGSRRLVLVGHSTGGLVMSLWADRHRGVADALILNSPWLELQLSGAVRKALLPVVGLRARINPHDLALPQLDLGFYRRAQSMVADPFDGGETNLEWRPEHSPPVLAGWLRAILDGHTRVAAGIDVGAPACVLLSSRSQFGVSWRDEMLESDTVLEVEGIARAALRLGPSVTVERIEGALHDVFLSNTPARVRAYERLEAWVTGWNAANPGHVASR